MVKIPGRLEGPVRQFQESFKGLKRQYGVTGTTVEPECDGLSQDPEEIPESEASIATPTNEVLEPHELAVLEYNNQYAVMTEAGQELLRQRERSADLILWVECLVNTIANTPKTFDAEIAEGVQYQKDFYDLDSFAIVETEAARKGFAGAGAGVAAGISVSVITPYAALWVASTFGTASTGTAISALSGAAAQQAALAWLGGGALAAGGGGVMAGNAFLALAGPAGWGVAGSAAFISIGFFFKKKIDLRKEKALYITAMKGHASRFKEIAAEISALNLRTERLRNKLSESYRLALPLHHSDYAALAPNEQALLASLVNNTHSCAELLLKTVNDRSHDV